MSKMNQTKKSQKKHKFSKLRLRSDNVTPRKPCSPHPNEKISSYFLKTSQEYDATHSENNSEDFQLSTSSGNEKQLEKYSLDNPHATVSDDENDFASPKSSKFAKIFQQKTQEVPKKKNSKSRKPTFGRITASCSDVNEEHLHLAIAMSKSVEDLENPSSADVIKNTYPSTQEKIITIKKTLEEFGFRTNKPRTELSKVIANHTQNTRKKFKYMTPTLFLRSEDERKRIIEDKVSQILNNIAIFNKNTNAIQRPETDPTDNKPKSFLLRDYYDPDATLYKKDSLDQSEMHNKIYYNKTVKPSEVKIGILLRDWSKIPGREKSPPLDDKFYEIKNANSEKDFIKTINKLSDDIEEPENLLLSIEKHANQIKTRNPENRSITPENNLSNTENLLDKSAKTSHCEPESISLINDITPRKKRKLFRSDNSDDNLKPTFHTPTRKSINFENNSVSLLDTISPKRNKNISPKNKQRSPVSKHIFKENQSIIMGDLNLPEKHFRPSTSKVEERDIIHYELYEECDNINDDVYIISSSSNDSLEIPTTLKRTVSQENLFENSAINMFESTENNPEKIIENLSSENQNNEASPICTKNENSCASLFDNSDVNIEFTSFCSNTPKSRSITKLNTPKTSKCSLPEVGNNKDEINISPEILFGNSDEDIIESTEKFVLNKTLRAVTKLKSQEVVRNLFGEIENNYSDNNSSLPVTKLLTLNPLNKENKNDEDVVIDLTQSSDKYEENKIVANNKNIEIEHSSQSSINSVGYSPEYNCFDTSKNKRFYDSLNGTLSEENIADLDKITNNEHLSSKLSPAKEINKEELIEDGNKSLFEHSKDNLLEKSITEPVIVTNTKDSFTSNKPEKKIMYSIEREILFVDSVIEINHNKSLINNENVDSVIGYNSDQKFVYRSSSDNDLKSISSSKSNNKDSKNILLTDFNSSDEFNSLVSKYTLGKEVSKSNDSINTIKENENNSEIELFPTEKVVNTENNQSDDKIEISDDEPNKSTTSISSIKFNISPSKIDNSLLINSPNKMRHLSQSSIDSCSDISDEELNYSSATPYKFKGPNKYYENIVEKYKTIDLETEFEKNLRIQELINNFDHLPNMDAYFKANLPVLKSASPEMIKHPRVTNLSTPNPANLKKSLSEPITPRNQTTYKDLQKNASVNDIENVLSEECTDEELLQALENQKGETVTPLKQVVVKTRNVTPMPNYSDMDTPRRNKELAKFGLKPLKRAKGIKMLRYIYDATHPVLEKYNEKVVESSSGDEDNVRVKRRKTNNIENAITRRNSEILKMKRSKNKGEIFTNENVEIVGNAIAESEPLERMIFERRQSSRIASCRLPLHIAWHNFVTSNQKIREKILLYEPLFVEELHAKLKSFGYNYHIQDLITFLDTKCITIRIAQNNCRRKILSSPKFM